MNIPLWDIDSTVSLGEGCDDMVISTVDMTVFWLLQLTDVEDRRVYVVCCCRHNDWNGPVGGGVPPTSTAMVDWLDVVARPNMGTD